MSLTIDDRVGMEDGAQKEQGGLMMKVEQARDSMCTATHRWLAVYA